MTWRDKYPLEKSKPLKKSIGTMVLAVFVMFFLSMFSIPVIVGVVLASFFGTAGLVAGIVASLVILLVLLGIVFALAYTYQVAYMKRYYYDLVGKNLVIKKGVFSVNEITLPLNRLQDVYVDQDILDRMFGLYDVHVSSATQTSGNLSHIDGINKESAEAIKKILLARLK